MQVTEFGIVTEVSPDDLNALSPIFVSPCGREIVFRFVHHLKEEGPMDVSEAGSVTDAAEPQV